MIKVIIYTKEYIYFDIKNKNMFLSLLNGWHTMYPGLHTICMVVVKCRSCKVESLEIYRIHSFFFLLLTNSLLIILSCHLYNIYWRKYKGKKCRWSGWRWEIVTCKIVRVKWNKVDQPWHSTLEFKLLYNPD